MNQSDVAFVKGAFIKVREDQRDKLPPYIRKTAPGRLARVSFAEERPGGLFVRFVFPPVKGSKKVEGEATAPSRRFEVVTDAAAIAAHEVAHQEYFTDKRASKESQEGG